MHGCAEHRCKQVSTGEGNVAMTKRRCASRCATRGLVIGHGVLTSFASTSNKTQQHKKASRREAVQTQATTWHWRRSPTLSFSTGVSMTTRRPTRIRPGLDSAGPVDPLASLDVSGQRVCRVPQEPHLTGSGFRLHWQYAHHRRRDATWVCQARAASLRALRWLVASRYSLTQRCITADVFSTFSN
jgi:hypothetical protein